MPLNDHVAFLHSLGWLAALMFAALLPSVAHLPGRRHAPWLAAFCASQLLVAAQELISPAPVGRWPGLAAVLSGTLLWEFARRTWNDHDRRHIPAVTHLLAAECLALVGATIVGSGGAHPAAWLLPIEMAFAALPALLGGAAALLLWRPFDRAALRLAAAAFGVFGVAGAFSAPVAALVPWLAAGALAAPMLALPETRTRAALACLGGLLLTGAAGPLAVSARLAQVQAEAHDDLIARAHRAAAPLQGSFAGRLAAEVPPSSETRRQLAAHATRIRASDPLLHSLSFWQERNDRRFRLDRAPDDETSESSAAPARAQGIQPFVDWQGDPERRGLVTVHAPVRVGVFENPSAWLALDYPSEFWGLQHEHARRTGVALIGVLAGFCAASFVLAGRHAIENAQLLEIARVRAADQAKTEFLAFLSHEMRTPLQTILGRAELLQAGATPTDGARRHGAAIETQSLLLLRLVTDLLDLGTLEAGKFQLRPHPFSLRRAIAAIEDTIRAPAAAKQLALEITIASTVPDHLIGDETRLRQVLGNVLGNAVKYTARGYVRFAVEREPGEENPAHLVFRVADSGPGLPPDKLP